MVDFFDKLNSRFDANREFSDCRKKWLKAHGFIDLNAFLLLFNDSSTIITAGRITTNIDRKSPFFTDITAILCFCQLELGVYRDKNNQG